MSNKQLKLLIKLLENYNEWCFVGRDKDINSLIENIKIMLLTN